MYRCERERKCDATETEGETKTKTRGKRGMSLERWERGARGACSFAERVRREGGTEGRRKRMKGASIGGAALCVNRASGSGWGCDASPAVRRRAVWSTFGMVR
jgi:hypothetical protein